MKLTRRLVLMIISSVVVLLAAEGAFEIRREIALFEHDVALDHELLGRALAQATRDAWSKGGDDYADHLSKEVSSGERFKIRWLRAVDAPDQSARFEHLSFTEWMSVLLKPEESRASFRTIAPVTIDGRVAGAFEIAESRAQSTAYLRESLLGTLGTLALVLAMSSAVVAALGRKYVARPTELLVESLRHAERLATVGQLAAGVAHELGTPLNVISARAELLAERPSSSANVLENAGIIEDQTRRLTQIVKQLLDFARRRPPKRAKEDLARVVHRTITILTPLAEQRGVELRELESAGFELDVDAGQIEQVLTNLTMNAIHAAGAGGTVRVELGRTVAWAFVRVLDDGPGIEPAFLPRLFEPFFTTKPVGEGTGLGLSVAHGIVAEHGGFISVESTVGMGSAFTVHLPAKGANHESVHS